jgi:CBS domain-containing protein
MLAREFRGYFTEAVAERQSAMCPNGQFVTPTTTGPRIHCGIAHDLFGRCRDCLEDCNAEARDPFVTLCTGVGDDEPELKEESAMATARELMTQGVECVNSTETLVEAARKMRDLDVGAMPICGEDQRLKGMLTDRDIVVKCIAEGKDPNSVRASDLAQGKPVTIGADDSAEETLRTMAKYQVRRLPVIDGHQLIGIVAQADVARALPNDVVGQVLEEVSEK